MWEGVGDRTELQYIDNLLNNDKKKQKKKKTGIRELKNYRKLFVLASTFWRVYVP